MTATNISINYTLLYVNGGSYNMQIYLPLELTGAVSDIRTTYGTIVSYDSNSTSLLTIRMNDITLLSSSLIITGFKTYQSTKPITYTIQILLQSTVYYFFTAVVSIPQPKQFNTLTISQNSSVVNQFDNLSVIISELQNNDILTYSTSSYSGYQNVNNTAWCSPSGIVSCNADSSVTFVSSSNADQVLKLT